MFVESTTSALCASLIGSREGSAGGKKGVNEALMRRCDGFACYGAGERFYWLLWVCCFVVSFDGAI